MKRISVVVSIFLILSISSLALASPVYQVSFPLVGILDDFNRVDQGPPPSANWSTISNGHVVSSNRMRGSPVGGDTNNVSETVATYGPDAQAYITIVTLPDDGGCIVIVVRANYPSVDGYGTTVCRDDINGDFLLLFGNDTLGVYTDFNFQVGDSIGVSAIDDQIESYYKPIGGVWRMTMSATDSAFSGDGNIIVVSSRAGDPMMDDFGGGTVEIIPTPTPTATTSTTFTSPIQARNDFAESFYILIGPFGYLVAAAITIMGILLFAVFVVLPPILRRI